MADGTIWLEARLSDLACPSSVGTCSDPSPALAACDALCSQGHQPNIIHGEFDGMLTHSDQSYILSRS